MNEPGPSSAYYRRFAETPEGPVRPPSPSRDPLVAPRETPEEFMDNQASDRLYAALNLPRDASTAEVKDRYRSLAAMYHPDKQPDDERRRAATSRFQEIQRAHEILTDPAQRTVYDMFGEEGLRTSWEVGPRNMTPGQMRDHFQRQGETKRKLDAEALIDSKGDVSVTVDARGVFLPRSAFSKPELVDHSPLARIQRLAVGQVLMKHSFQTPINDTTQMVVEGTMAAMNGKGGANVSGTIKHQFSPRIWAQVSQSFLFPRISSVKATYTHDDLTFVTANAVSQTWAAPPRVTLTLGRRLYSATTGFITYNSGFFALGPWGANLPAQLAMQDTGGVSVGMTTANQNGTGWTTEVAAGLASTGISTDYTTMAMGLKLKVGAGYDLVEGPNGFADATARVTDTTRLGAMVRLQPSGVRLNIHFGRMGQRVNLPILLSFNLNPHAVFWTTVAPAAAWAALYHWYLVPRKARKVSDRIRRLRHDYKDYIDQKRQEAHDAVLLLERPAAQRADAERAKGGLVILDAHYGRADAFTPRGMREQPDEDGNPAVIDVTVPLQALVTNSRLYIPAGPAKYNLIGFYDPCIGEPKKLRVRYLFRGEVHEVDVDDTASLRAPVKAHAIEKA